jgi:dethiobiotin synthetase
VFLLASTDIRRFHATHEAPSVTAIFITATGTHVGKTFVAASLIGHLGQMGRTVEAIKPIVTGFDPAQAATSDPGVLLTALGLPLTPAALDRVSPWRFRASASPDIAAQVERRKIEIDQVIAFCEEAISRRRDILLIEGIGGIMVPLNEQHTILDVMMALRVPLILVAGSYPGTISHTLTALDALYRRDLNVLAIIVNESPGSRMPLDATVASIARFADPVIAVPRGRGTLGDSGAKAALGRIFSPRGGAER